VVLGRAWVGDLVMSRGAWGDGVKVFFANNSAPIGPIWMKLSI